MRQATLTAVFTAVAVLTGAAVVPVAGAAPGTAAVRYRAVATRVGPAVVLAGRAGVGWRGRTADAPGWGIVNAGGLSFVLSVWCGSAGACAAAGAYPVGQGLEDFVVSQKHGVWGREIEVPGLSALNRGAVVLRVSMSCGSAGNCAVGGDYGSRFGDFQGFAASERNGVWGKAIKMPGPGLSTASGPSDVWSVSCGSARSCTVGGAYSDHRNRAQGFVAVERKGVWGKAVEVPGLGALNAGGSAKVTTVSCAQAGDCAAGGGYEARAGHFQGFVAVERKGVWGKAVEVPGLGALNAGRAALVTSVSCAAAGYCAAGGDYLDRSGAQQGFVTVERNGVWGKAVEVPGLRALNAGGFADVTSVSCAAAGHCAAGGDYATGQGFKLGFVASQRKGAWGKAIRMPGRGSVDAEVSAVWCASARYCAAGGDSLLPSKYGFVVSERSGRWGKPARLVPPKPAPDHPISHGATSTGPGRLRAPDRAYCARLDRRAHHCE